MWVVPDSQLLRHELAFLAESLGVSEQSMNSRIGQE
jgi:hypothetical protein